MWSKDIRKCKLKMFKAVGLTNQQEIIVTWIEEYVQYRFQLFYTVEIVFNNFRASADYF